MSDIILNPEYQKLNKEIKKIKQDVADLYEEKDELVFHICKNIETEYMSKIGVLEYKLYEYQCRLLRLKRKIELYQMLINRQEEPNEERIEEILDTEYREYEEKLNNLFNEIQSALDRKNYVVLTEEQSIELKSIYRRLIKKLHPDLNKDSNEKNKKILLQLIHAYENSDLEMMRNLELLTNEIIEKDEEDILPLEDLRAYKQKYEDILKELLEKIKKIKESFPYNKKEFLKNDVLIKKRRDEISIEIEQYKKLYKEFEKILKQLKGEING